MRRRALYTGSSAVAAVAALAAYGVFHEGIAYRRDGMAQTNVQQENPGRQRAGGEEAMRLARDAMSRYGFEVASNVVMGLVLNDIPQQARYDIIREYSEKYRALALARLRSEAVSMGSSYEDMVLFPKDNPRLFGFMKAVSYGIALFGERGFNSALELIRDGRSVRDPDRAGYPLIHHIGLMAANLVLENNLIPKERALETLARGILAGSVQIPEKELYMRIAFAIDPEVACRLRPGTDGETRALLDHHIQTTLKGKVSCG
jgi:hypothetical protein